VKEKLIRPETVVQHAGRSKRVPREADRSEIAEGRQVYWLTAGRLMVVAGQPVAQEPARTNHPMGMAHRVAFVVSSRSLNIMKAQFRPMNEEFA
jgi:hypothetical protein